GKCLFNYLSQLFAVVRRSQVIPGTHFERLDHAAAFKFFAKRSDEMLAVEFADGFAVNFCFREVADYQVEAVEVVTAERLRSFPSHDHFMTEPPEGLFE